VVEVRNNTSLGSSTSDERSHYLLDTTTPPLRSLFWAFSGCTTVLDKLVHFDSALRDNRLPLEISDNDSYILTMYSLNSFLLCLHSSLHNVLSLLKQSL
jgi:hypothetical protein